MARLISLLDNFQISQTQQQTPVVDVTANQNSRQRISNIKLPRLNLSVFTGKCSEWTPFAQMFRTMISENKNLTDVEKFQYLHISI